MIFNNSTLTHSNLTSKVLHYLCIYLHDFDNIFKSLQTHNNIEVGLEKCSEKLSPKILDESLKNIYEEVCFVENVVNSEMLELCTTPYLLFTNFLFEHFLMYLGILGRTLIWMLWISQCPLNVEFFQFLANTLYLLWFLFHIEKTVYIFIYWLITYFLNLAWC